MGTISSEAQKITWGIGQELQGKLNTLKDSFNAIVGRAKATVAGFTHGDVVGINGEAVPGMKESIRQYVANLQSHLKEVKSSADNSQAFKGEYASAVTDYINAVCDACECIISELLVFNQKLEEVYQAYLAKDTEMSSNIKGQAGELNSQFTRYDADDANITSSSLGQTIIPGITAGVVGATGAAGIISEKEPWEEEMYNDLPLPRSTGIPSSEPSVGSDTDMSSSSSPVVEETELKESQPSGGVTTTGEEAWEHDPNEALSKTKDPTDRSGELIDYTLPDMKDISVDPNHPYAYATYEEKAAYVLEEYGITEEQLDVITAIVRAEAKNDSYTDAYNVASTMYNRLTQWNNKNLYKVATASGQFVVYEHGSYKYYLGDTESVDYKATLDMLTFKKTGHDHLYFKSTDSNPTNKVQFEDRGNRYHD